jgi:hypothetical protein
VVTSASPTMPAQFGTCAFPPTLQNKSHGASPRLAASVHRNFRNSTRNKNHSPQIFRHSTLCRCLPLAPRVNSRKLEKNTA